MGDKVYLWELDSVRTSEKQCQLAQTALQKAILLEGNVVIITFNQLADARWMLPILENDTDFQCLMRLFEIGAIRVSNYKDMRTASRYIQRSLEIARKSNSNFIFSGMPISSDEDDLLQKVLDALRYSDPELMAEYISDLEAKNGDVQEIKRLNMIYRYIKLILLVSRGKITKNASVEYSPSFSEILNRMCAIGRSELENYDINWLDMYEEAIFDLKNIEIEVENQEKRSCWYDKIEELCSQDQTNRNLLRDFQKRLIDVCYNYTVEVSIGGITRLRKQTESNCSKSLLMQEYVERITTCYNEICDKNYIAVKANNTKKVEWRLVVEIYEDVKEYIEVSKNKQSKEKMSWFAKVVVTQVWLPVRNFLFYFGMFLFLNIFTEIMTTEFELLPQINAWMGKNVGFLALIETVLFGTVGSLLSKWLSIPDILDIWGGLFHKIRNICCYLIYRHREGKKHAL